jgi:hypothetical protein
MQGLLLLLLLLLQCQAPCSVISSWYLCHGALGTARLPGNNRQQHDPAHDLLLASPGPVYCASTPAKLYPTGAALLWRMG